ASGRTYRVLDLATGGGDFPRVMVDWARRQQIQLAVDAIDANAAIISLATRWSEDYPEIRFLHADMLTYCAERPYDFVHSSLFLHHLGTCDAVELLRRCLLLSRELILITDLERHFLTRLGVGLLNRLLLHQRMT